MTKDNSSSEELSGCYDLARKVIIVTLGIVISIALGIATMIWGWGLTPKDWRVIVGLGILGRFFVEIFVQLGKAK